MNLLLAEFLNSVPPEFSVKERTKQLVRFHYKNKEIYVNWWKDGQPWEIAYHEDGEWHRPPSEGPAYQSWYSNGQPCRISYYENGRQHRPPSKGPASQSWNPDGTLDSEQYWENGKKLK